MKKYKIVCSDLDGTLLDSNGKASAQNLRAIEQLAARGVIFVPSTGRAFSDLPAELRDHPSIRYFICSTGASVVDRHAGKSHLSAVSRPLLAQVFSILDRYEIHLTVRQGGTCYVDQRYANAEAFDYYNVSGPHQEIVNHYAVWHDSFPAFCQTVDDVEMVAAFFKDRDEWLAAQKEIETLGGLRVALAFDCCIEITNVDAGKGNAMLWLADHLGIDREDTLSVGDSDNDATILQAAGLGLAVSNACPSLMEVADEVICSNDEHAIEYILNNYC